MRHFPPPTIGDDEPRHRRCTHFRNENIISRLSGDDSFRVDTVFVCHGKLCVPSSQTPQECHQKWECDQMLVLPLSKHSLRCTARKPGLSIHQQLLGGQEAAP
jgi:hypothetical protein